jgi:hypothetical protein
MLVRAAGGLVEAALPGRARAPEGLRLMCATCQERLAARGIVALTWTTPDGRPPLDGMREAGRRFGYPECCIEAFVADVERGCLPGTLRGSAPVPGRPDAVYVPCPECKAKLEAVPA